MCYNQRCHGHQGEKKSLVEEMVHFCFVKLGRLLGMSWATESMLDMKYIQVVCEESKQKLMQEWIIIIIIIIYY
jgi:hypothetical protein